MDWFDDFKQLFDEKPISEMKKHMNEFSICDVKFRHNGLQIHAHVSDKGNFTLYFRKLKKNEKELK